MTDTYKIFSKKEQASVTVTDDELDTQSEPRTKGSLRENLGPKRFDQRNIVFEREYWDQDFIARLKEVRQDVEPLDAITAVLSGHRFCRLSTSIREGLSYAEFGTGVEQIYVNRGLCETADGPVAKTRVPVDPEKMTRYVKEVTKIMGADLVGVCELDQRWVYSHEYGYEACGGVTFVDHRPLNIPHKYAVSIAVEMDYELQRASPSYLSAVATGLGYSKMRYISTMLANWIRGLGYPAMAHGNERVLNIPIAIDAGLGELGRLGLLITREFGPRVRLCSVTTDLPLVPDKPSDIGVQDFCRTCNRCAACCPAQAISKGDKTAGQVTSSTSPGVLKWPINPEKCFLFWNSNPKRWMECARCISVCPWSKRNTRLHRTVTSIIKRTPKFNRTIVWLDNCLGFSKKLREQPYTLHPT